jgi:hypothetical protein
MKKFFFLLFVNLISCGSTVEVVSEATSTTVSTVVDVSTTTTTEPPSTSTTKVNMEPKIEVVCEAIEPTEVDNEGYIGFKFKMWTGSTDLEVLNMVFWVDSSRADDLFIYEDLPAPNEYKESIYWVDDSFTQYEIEVLLMDKNDNFATDYCLWNK